MTDDGLRMADERQFANWSIGQRANAVKNYGWRIQKNQKSNLQYKTRDDLTANSKPQTANQRETINVKRETPHSSSAFFFFLLP